MKFVVDRFWYRDLLLRVSQLFWLISESILVDSFREPERRGISRCSQIEGGAVMASAWQRAIATAKIVATVASSASASEREASEYVRNVLTYQERQRLEERLRQERDLDAAAWVSQNS